jgi:hypothetical protein
MLLWRKVIVIRSHRRRRRRRRKEAKTGTGKRTFLDEECVAFRDSLKIVLSLPVKFVLF